jgi:hypothetical protein
MNFEEENLKPLYLTKRASILNKDLVSLAAANSKAAQLTNDGKIFIKASAFKEAPSLIKEALAHQETASDLEDLIVARLEAIPTKRFRFVGGREYTGAEAASEVRKHSEIGQYFTRLEKATLQIARDAAKHNKFGG